MSECISVQLGGEVPELRVTPEDAAALQAAQEWAELKLAEFEQEYNSPEAIAWGKAVFAEAEQLFTAPDGVECP